MFIFIYLAALGLVEACGILGLHCGLWELFKVSKFGKYENSILYLHIEHSVGGKKTENDSVSLWAY